MYNSIVRLFITQFVLPKHNLQVFIQFWSERYKMRSDTCNMFSTGTIQVQKYSICNVVHTQFHHTEYLKLKTAIAITMLVVSTLYV